MIYIVTIVSATSLAWHQHRYFYSGRARSDNCHTKRSNCCRKHGIGCVYLSSIQNDIRPLIQILKLPKLTFPLVAMQIGIPAQMPERKSRLPLVTCSFEQHHYQNLFTVADFAEYNKIVQTYYGVRDSNQRIDSFTTQIASNLSNTHYKRGNILDIIHKQDFCAL
ncbi:hypothetical protein [Snodgrassella sp.]|uniref:hypothetical protein n=1 Tax=Snodgrassella sp. TaxID=2815304 RepID=UPI0025887DA3|nr:hypothetical protein [Snodgrassella sp.]MCO6526518.1 hypothetical protein [Snodgrassella sp.]